MPRPISAIIDIAALQHNLRVAKTCSPRAKVWAIVKANAYGHGLDNAVTAFALADGLGLIEIDAAVDLRARGWRKPVLLLEGFFQPADLQVVADCSLDTAIHCNEQIAMLEAAHLALPVDIHLKMNTGMNRLGFTPAEFRVAYHRLRMIPSVRNITLMTHFANADEPLHGALPLAEQMRRFDSGAQGLAGALSLSNSAGSLMHSELHSDWIRPGIMLYGGTPGGKSAESFGLLPAMTLTSEIIGVQQIDIGDAVGYGSRFIANRPTRVGVVACGYADGYPRHAPNGTPVLVDGLRTELIGRVSMDMLTVDLSTVPSARIGSKVVLWGAGLPIDEVANASGTIGYELMCARAQRVPLQVHNDVTQHRETIREAQD
ncbi:MAG: alanine racemase [Herminiimonas sp.]|nr:alanine racemase [Herminiimonas sp.]